MMRSRDVIQTVNRRDVMSAPLIRKLALAAALACAAAPAVAKKAPDNLVPAGKPVDCIQLSAIRSTDVRDDRTRSEEHTSELQSLMRISYAVFCLKKKTQQKHHKDNT